MSGPGGSSASAVVAAFDLDGTLTSGHSTVDFVTGLAGWPRVLVAATGGAFAAGFPPSRPRWKEAAIGRVLGGRAEDEVRRAGRDFAVELMEHRLIPEAADQLAAHLAVGHEVVLVSAALDVYVDAVGELLGAGAVIATAAEVRDGRFTGRLIDADLHDERKVQRLTAWLGEREPHATVFAYGNSEDDDEMLHYAAMTQARVSSSPRRVAGPADGAGQRWPRALPDAGMRRPNLRARPRTAATPEQKEPRG